MKNIEHSNQLFQQANHELSTILKTWNNSKPDSVSFIICHSVKECLENFLKSYLLLKTGKLSRTRSLAALLAKCTPYDARLKKIDLRWITCKNHNFKTSVGIFCTSLEQIEVCMLIANGIRNFVGEELSKTKAMA